jgi:hypothetical protein
MLRRQREAADVLDRTPEVADGERGVAAEDEAIGAIQGQRAHQGRIGVRDHIQVEALEVRAGRPGQPGLVAWDGLPRPPPDVQPLLQVREGSPEVGQADRQPRKALHDPAEDQACRGKRRLEREPHREVQPVLVDRRLARRIDGMDEDRQVLGLDALVEGPQVGMVQRLAVDVRAHLHAGEAQRLGALELAQREPGVLERQGRQADEARRVARHHGRHLVVEDLA